MDKQCIICRKTFWDHPKSNMTRCQDCPPPLKSYPMFYEHMKPDLPEIRKTWPRPRYKLKTKSKNILED